jgi:glycerol-3-phosphate acyltransferase PlsX
MKIAIDVMGGDYAPKELVLGARSYIESGGEASLILVGDENAIKEHFPQMPANCEIYHTEQTIEMGESPLNALRKKKNASVAVAARLVKEGKAAAFISAGSTGAQMAASLLEIGRIPGIDRPAISVMLPSNEEYGVLLLDVGANVDIKAQHLHQFAIMGAAYYEKICGIENPKVGILSIGEEESKGNELTKAAYPLLKSDSNLNFVGNVEADSLYYGKAHVVVCDGFAGNLILKASESLSELIQTAMLKTATVAEIPMEKLLVLKQGLKKFNPDSEEYSSAPLLGLNGISMVCHGKAKAKVIANAIRLASNCAETAFVELIKQKLEAAKKE